MRLFRSVVLYTALAALANTAVADTTDIEALKTGTMQKLVFARAPQEVPDTVFTDPDGAEHRLSDWRGRTVLVNFWATWCAPCREEMPSLDRLQAEMGGDDFAVLTIATGRNPLPAVMKFFDEQGIETLPILLDPGQQLSRDMGVLALPMTMLLNSEGQEIARLIGDAEWDGESARAIVGAVTDTRTDSGTGTEN